MTKVNSSEEKAAAALEADLARRANPEKSRLFDKDTLLRSRETLLAMTDELERAGIFRAGPERITIVGTNGKGSTAFYLAGLAEKERIGLYTSPHFLSFLERIRIDGRPVTAQFTWAAFDGMRDVFGSRFDDLSYFEALTLAARYLFDDGSEDDPCPFQVFEAGLGGRFDAVHIARSPTIVLTPVELDHMKILGDTVEAILREKLAVISPHTKRLIVMHQRHWEESFVREEALRAAENAGCGGLEIAFFNHPGSGDAAGRIGSKGRSYLELNKEFARFILERIGLTRRSDCPPPPGRLEWQESGLTKFFYDAGHNPAALDMILDALLSDSRYPGPDRTIFCFACLKDRSPADIEEKIRKRGIEHILQITGPGLAPEVRPGFARSADGALAAALAFARKAANEAPVEPILIAVAGSHYIYDFFIEVQRCLKEVKPA